MMANTQHIENCKKNLQQGSLGRDIAASKVFELKQNFIMLNQNIKEEIKTIRNSVVNDQDMGRTQPEKQLKATSDLTTKAAFIMSSVDVTN